MRDQILKKSDIIACLAACEGAVLEVRKKYKNKQIHRILDKAQHQCKMCSEFFGLKELEDQDIADFADQMKILENRYMPPGFEDNSIIVVSFGLALIDKLIGLTGIIKNYKSRDYLNSLNTAMVELHNYLDRGGKDRKEYYVAGQVADHWVFH